MLLIIDPEMIHMVQKWNDISLEEEVDVDDSETQTLGGLLETAKKQ